MTDLEGIISELLDGTKNCPFSEWPGNLNNLDLPGLYAWWVSESGAALITSRLGKEISPGIVYVGQAGAGSSTATLRSRIESNHISGKIRQSTLRLTAATILLEDLKGFIEGDRKIGVRGEAIVTAWLSACFNVTVAAYPDRINLGELEKTVLDHLDPPFNLSGMDNSPLRSEIGDRRRVFRQMDMNPRRNTSMSSSESSLIPVHRSDRSITLHEEIAAILAENLNRWMATSEIAELVNERGIYIKRNLSKMTDYQIHGRTRNYRNLFERNGSKVRLISA